MFAFLFVSALLSRGDVQAEQKETNVEHQQTEQEQPNQNQTQLKILQNNSSQSILIALRVHDESLQTINLAPKKEIKNPLAQWVGAYPQASLRLSYRTTRQSYVPVELDANYVGLRNPMDSHEFFDKEDGSVAMRLLK